MASQESWSQAVFGSPADAQDALRKLEAAGVAARDIEVRSSIPFEGLHPAGYEPRTHVPLMAVIGGVLGGTAAILMVALSSMAYPLPTGGMPIVPAMTTGIITFEGTAIGAILCTVGTVLVEGGLLRFGRPPKPLDAYLAAGNIIIAVRSAAGRSTEWMSRAVATDAPSGGSES